MDIAVSHTFDTHSQRNQGRRACLQGQPCKYLRIDGAAPLTAATARAGSHRIGPRIRERRQGSGPHPIICRAPPPRHRQGERASPQATDSPPRCRSTIAARSIGDRDAPTLITMPRALRARSTNCTSPRPLPCSTHTTQSRLTPAASASCCWVQPRSLRAEWRTRPMSAFAVKSGFVGVRLRLAPEGIGVREEFSIKVDHRLHHLGE